MTALQSTTASSDRAVTVAAVGSLHALQHGLRQPRGDYSRHETPNQKGPPETTDGPKSLKGFSLAIALPCLAASILHADWLAGAGLMLALHWPSGPWPLDAGLWTLVPSDPGRHRHWSLGALVVFGSGWCEKPARSTTDNPTANPTNSPDDHQGFLHKVWSPSLSKHAPPPPTKEANCQAATLPAYKP